MRPEFELTPRQSKAIEALLEGKNHNEAAAIAEVSIRQLRRWMRRPHVKQELRVQRTRARRAGGHDLAAGAAACARSLIDLSRNALPTDGVRLSACKAVLDFALRHEELIEVKQRLDDLERQLAAPKPASEGGAWS
jgi:hypothetical protein